MKRIVTFAIAAILTLSTLRVAAEPAVNDATTEVVASGVGVDADKALRNALMNAVQEAVGLVVDAETLVKNEDVIKDQILTYSDGYVEHFDKIKDSKRDDGLFEIKIRATIKRRQLIEKLKASKVIATKVDGASLFAEVTTQLEAEKSAAKLLEKSLADLPLNLLSARVANSKPKILQQDDSGVRASWTLIVAYDYQAYKEKVLPALRKVLGDLAKRKGILPILVKLNNIPLSFGLCDLPKFTPVTRSVYWHVAYMGIEPPHDMIPVRESEICVMLHEDRDKVTGDERLSWYVLDASCLPVLSTTSSRQPNVRITLRDAGGVAVHEDSLNMGSSPSIYLSGRSRAGSPETTDSWPLGKWFPSFVSPVSEGAAGLIGCTYVIAPLFRIGEVEKWQVQGEAMDLGWSVHLSLEEMKKVTAIECKLVETVQGTRK